MLVQGLAACLWQVWAMQAQLKTPQTAPAGLSESHFQSLTEPLSGALLVFDRVHFGHQTFGDDGLQRELIGLFLAQAEEAVHTMAAPVSATAWRFLTHTLKGAALAIGAARIAARADAWERAPAPDANRRNALRALLLAELAEFRTSAQDLLA